jgi:hypothetical protein
MAKNKSKTDYVTLRNGKDRLSERSVHNYHSTPRNIPDERISQIYNRKLGIVYYSTSFLRNLETK